jgi:hypothetical protein
MEDLRRELHGVTSAVHLLVEHMDESLPEERMKRLVNAVVVEERLGRRRLAVTIVGALLIIIILTASSFIQSHSNGRTLNEAKTVADYVRNCLQRPERLKTVAEKTETCGSSSDQGAFFITYLNCVLRVEIDKRDDETLNGCVAKATTAAGG